MVNLLIMILAGAVSFCNGAIETPELSKITVNGGVKHLEDNKDLESSPSDRSFLIGREYGYNGVGSGNGYGYANYPGGIYSSYNRDYTPNSVYWGYQSGLNGIPGRNNLGWRSYGTGYGSYGGVGSTGYYGNGVGNGLSYAGYDGRWNGADSYGSYVGSSGYRNYPYVYNGIGGYPSGYRGYT